MIALASPALSLVAGSLLETGEFLIGPEGSKANPFQTILRSILVYGFALLLVRLGHKRLLGGNSGIDILLTIILGSVLSRGINGSSSLGSTLAASAALVGPHWVFAAWTFRSKRVGRWIKAEDRVLVENGQMQPETMRGSHISEEDLREALRIQGKLEDLAKVERAPGAQRPNQPDREEIPRPKTQGAGDCRGGRRANRAG